MGRWDIPTSTGAKRHRVTLQRQEPGETDEYGQEQEVWADVASYWALVEFREGKIADSGRGLYERTGLITLRYIGEIAAGTHRFLFGSRVLHITAVEDVLDRHRELRINYRELEGEAP